MSRYCSLHGIAAQHRTMLAVWCDLRTSRPNPPPHIHPTLILHPPSPSLYFILSPLFDPLISPSSSLTTHTHTRSTALFVATATEYFPSVSLGLITAVLTAFTLFFGELLPKALAVSNSELVARKVRCGIEGEKEWDGGRQRRNA